MHAILAFILTLAAAPALAAPIRCGEDGEGGACVWGKAEGFDGATVQIRGLKVHLVGITVPSRRDLCANRASKEEFDCARPARRRMAELVGKGLACDILDVSADRLHGRCKVADGDLGRLLVAAGTAKALKDSPYESEQTNALTQHRGLWHADIILPKDWEAVRRRSDKAE
jgi:endonuclease YncB( thermonuclease family)